MRGDFNDIRGLEEKKGGRIRSKASCREFREFIGKMFMEKIVYQGREWTWSNNWQEERFIKARLDRFLGSSQWLMDFEEAVV